MTGDSVRSALQNLKVRPPARRDDAVNALLRRLADPAAVRAIVAAAPGSIPRQLHAIALETLRLEGADLGDDAKRLRTRRRFPLDDYQLNSYRRNSYRRNGYAHDDYAGDDDALDAVNSNVYQLRYGRFAQRNQAMRWAIERGLMNGPTFAPGPFMPTEIAVALSGRTIHAPFTPYPPPIPTAAVDPATVDSGAAAAAADFAGQAVAVLDLIARAPLPQLKSGGVGARELTRVAKATAIDESAARLVIELAAELGLLGMDAGFLRATEAYPLWRELEPAAAYSTLLETWLIAPFNPTESIDREGRTIRLRHRNGPRRPSSGPRRVPDRTGLAAARAVDHSGGGGTRIGLGATELGYVPQDATKPYATVWAEAVRLGLVAAGALSPIGRALDDRDRKQLASLLQAMLPANTDSARFGSDLTVLVSGSPSARVSGLLDRTADRESRGAGVTWRFSPASVRHAMDEGADAGGLLADLEAIAIGELPQPLRYLINDVARRHGELEVSRRCRSSVVKTRRCSPGRPPIGVARARAAAGGPDRPGRHEVRGRHAAGPAGGRLPARARTPRHTGRGRTERVRARSGSGACGADPTATAACCGRPARRDPHRRTERGHARRGPRAAARAGHASARHRTRSMTPNRSRQRRGVRPAAACGRPFDGAALGRLDPRLTADELHQLAHAIESGGPVSITYEPTSGARTHRVIGDAKLGGGMLDAWCYLRDDERYFLVDRIHSVAPGPEPRANAPAAGMSARRPG